MCGCLQLDSGVVPGSGSGESASELELDFTTTDAVPVVTGLISLPADGAHALISDFAMQLVNETAGVPGQGAGGWNLNFATALRNAPDGSVIIAAPRLGGGVAPAVLWATGIPAGGGGVALGYGPGPVFGAPLVPAPTLAIAANVVTLTCTGIAATTLRWHVRARVWVFDGAVRLV